MLVEDYFFLYICSMLEKTIEKAELASLSEKKSCEDSADIFSSEKKLRADLAAAYQLLAKLKMDDLTYTHLSLRCGKEQAYFIYPFGLLFSEVTAENLLKVSFAGEVLEGSEYQYNKTGYIIHSAIYQARPEVNAIIHLHTTAGVAVSAQACGLLPISQFSFHFYNRISYHDYNALALEPEVHGLTMAEDLKQNYAMILRNHGTLTCGHNIHHAFFLAYYLEQACKVQVAALGCSGSGKQNLVMPDPAVCEQAAQDMRNFESDLGLRDWLALRRFYKV